MLLSSIVYGVCWTPSTAWHPFSRRSFKSLGVIVHLGLAGVGQTATEWWSWELVGCKSINFSFRVNRGLSRFFPLFFGF